MTRQTLVSDILENSFYILGADPWESVSAILSLANKNGGSSSAEKAANTLQDSESRFFMELSWLPTLTFREANLLVEDIKTDPARAMVKSVNNLKLARLSKCNIIMWCIKSMPYIGIDVLAQWLYILSAHFTINAVDETLLLINQSRQMAGMQAISRSDAAFKKSYKAYVCCHTDFIKKTLDNLSALELATIMLKLVEWSIEDGIAQKCILIKYLVHIYELHIQYFLQKEEANIHSILETMAKTKPDKQNWQNLQDWLKAALENTAFVTAPVRKLASYSNAVHLSTFNIINTVKNFAIALYWSHPDECQRIMKIIENEFGETKRKKFSISLEKNYIK